MIYGGRHVDPALIELRNTKKHIIYLFICITADIGSDGITWASSREKLEKTFGCSPLRKGAVIHNGEAIFFTRGSN